MSATLLLFRGVQEKNRTGSLPEDKGSSEEYLESRHDQEPSCCRRHGERNFVQARRGIKLK